ncbi:acyltransferase [Marinococcus halotolerans]|jgi:acetyltransferase-like isoleucine patch superfamily enzyme|uniref:acyltransferase n=1 Tax=Marinococcus halotolerans TaxID=301092 RepID=UPI0003B66536|nr:acyltransferase [Marinococcus halotolerans]
MRKTDRYFPGNNTNALWQMYRTVPFLKAFRNTAVIEASRVVPFVSVKRWMYRQLLGMEIGEKTALAYKVMPDLMFPEKIHIGSNSIIGYQSTLLTHEHLIDEYRLGDIVIGNEVMIGANVTILPGVTIGDRAVVAAGTVVHKDVPARAFAGGSPMRIRT